jgi:membrane protease YdiL (CAAX protease family)
VSTRARASTSAAAVAKPRPVRVAFASPVGLHARSSRALRARAGNNPPGPLDGLADGISADKVKAAVEASRLASEDGSEELLEVENVPPMQFLLSSVAFYALMGVGSQVASSFLGVHPDVLDGTRALNLDTASLWTVPLLASLAFAITQADKFEFLGEVRDIFKVGVLPSLAPLGLPGVVALSLGAGVGEEAFFRGFLMPFCDGGLTNLGVPENLSSVGVLAGTSVFFGALHAITPAYFYWATGAGALFGLEYMRDGLGTAMVTHTLYDFLAFGFILIAWPVDAKEKGIEETT